MAGTCDPSSSAAAEEGEAVHYMATANGVRPRQCAAQIAALLPGAQVQTGKASLLRGVTFRAPTSAVRQLARLSLPERIYAIVAAVPVDQIQSRTSGQHAELLLNLEALATSAPGWSSALATHQLLHGDIERTIAVNGKRGGTRFRGISSDRLAAALGGALSDTFGWRVDLRTPTLELTAHLNDEGLLLTLALLHRPASIEGRSRVAGGLDATVAWAMARSAAPLPDGALVVDPMCGAGATLIECLAENPSVLGFGADLSQVQLGRAQANRAALPPTIALRMALARADARCLPLLDGAASAVICDLPWGDKWGAPKELTELYAPALMECARVLRSGAKAVILTSDEMMAVLREAALGAGFRLLAERQCPLGFSKSIIVVMEKPALVPDDDVSWINDIGQGTVVRRLPWEGSEGRSEWTALRKMQRPPMRPWAASAPHWQHELTMSASLSRAYTNR